MFSLSAPSKTTRRRKRSDVTENVYFKNIFIIRNSCVLFVLNNAVVRSKDIRYLILFDICTPVRPYSTMDHCVVISLTSQKKSNWSSQRGIHSGPKPVNRSHFTTKALDDLILEDSFFPCQLVSSGFLRRSYLYKQYYAETFHKEKRQEARNRLRP